MVAEVSPGGEEKLSGIGESKLQDLDFLLIAVASKALVEEEGCDPDPLNPGLVPLNPIV